MIESILMVCAGNICRSPLAEYEMRRLAPALKVSSAGVSALIGSRVDPRVARLAESDGLDLSAHRARQIEAEMLYDHDLVIVMEPTQRDWLVQRFPQDRAKVVLLSHWSGGGSVPDPFRRSQPVYELVHRKILACCDEWRRHLQLPAMDRLNGPE